MFANFESASETRKRRDENRSARRSAFLTMRAKESIELTEALAEELEAELAQFAKYLRALQ